MKKIIFLLALTLVIPFQLNAQQLSDSGHDTHGARGAKGKGKQPVAPQVCYAPGYGPQSVNQSNSQFSGLGQIYGPPAPTPVPVPTPPVPLETPTPPGPVVTATPTPPANTPTPVRVPTPVITSTPSAPLPGNTTSSWADFRRAESSSYQAPSPTPSPTIILIPTPTPPPPTENSSP